VLVAHDPIKTAARHDYDSLQRVVIVVPAGHPIHSTVEFDLILTFHYHHHRVLILLRKTESTVLLFTFQNLTTTTNTMADNDDDLVDYDEEEVRLLPRSFIASAESSLGCLSPESYSDRIFFKVRYNLRVESYVDSFPFSLRCGKKSKATTEHTSSPPCTLHSNPIQSNPFVTYLLPSLTQLTLTIHLH
jgi:hypothetical protein